MFYQPTSRVTNNLWVHIKHPTPHCRKEYSISLLLPTTTYLHAPPPTQHTNPQENKNRDAPTPDLNPNPTLLHIPSGACVRACNTASRPTIMPSIISLCVCVCARGGEPSSEENRNLRKGIPIIPSTNCLRPSQPRPPDRRRPLLECAARPALQVPLPRPGVSCVYMYWRTKPKPQRKTDKKRERGKMRQDGEREREGERRKDKAKLISSHHPSVSPSSHGLRLSSPNWPAPFQSGERATVCANVRPCMLPLPPAASVCIAQTLFSTPNDQSHPAPKREEEKEKEKDTANPNQMERNYQRLTPLPLSLIRCHPLVTLSHVTRQPTPPPI